MFAEPSQLMISRLKNLQDNLATENPVLIVMEQEYSKVVKD